MPAWAPFWPRQQELCDTRQGPHHERSSAPQPRNLIRSDSSCFPVMWLSHFSKKKDIDPACVVIIFTLTIIDLDLDHSCASYMLVIPNTKYWGYPFLGDHRNSTDWGWRTTQPDCSTPQWVSLIFCTSSWWHSRNTSQSPLVSNVVVLSGISQSSSSEWQFTTATGLMEKLRRRFSASSSPKFASLSGSSSNFRSSRRSFSAQGTVQGEAGQ